MKKNKLIIATTLDVIVKNDEFYIDMLVCSRGGDLIGDVFGHQKLLRTIFFLYKDFRESLEKWRENPQSFLEEIVPSKETLSKEAVFVIVVHPYCVDDLVDILDDINNLYQKFDVIDFDELEEGLDEELIDQGEIVSIAMETTKKQLFDYSKN